MMKLEWVEHVMKWGKEKKGKILCMPKMSSDDVALGRLLSRISSFHCSRWIFTIRKWIKIKCFNVYCVCGENCIQCSDYIASIYVVMIIVKRNVMNSSLRGKIIITTFIFRQPSEVRRSILALLHVVHCSLVHRQIRCWCGDDRERKYEGK